LLIIPVLLTQNYLSLLKTYSVNSTFSSKQVALYLLYILFDDTIDKHGKLIGWQELEIL